MSKPARTCLFCGRRGTSKEHILSQWIGKSFTQSVASGIDVELAHETFAPDGTLVRRKNSKRTAFVALSFCEECNNTWMGRLDDQVKPILLPMMFARPRLALTVPDQRLLTLWLTKVALGFQTLEPDESTWARPEHFRALYETSAPLTGSQAWIGAREHWYPAMYRGHSTALRGQDGAVDGFGVVLSVGFVVFWLLVPYTPSRQLHLYGDSAMAAKPIWPGLGRDIVWPPARTIAGVDLTGLPHRLLESSRLA